MKTPTHVSNRFQFEVRAPLATTAVLFAPEAERGWVGKDWNPEFIYPQPAADVPGAVFTVQQGAQKSVWVNTRFDVEGGRMQYVSFVPETLVSTVEVCLTPLAPSRTGVEVTYSRTALDASANERVEALGASDREKGPHWQDAIERYLDH
ncbi:MAG TPA: hypothetical protein VME43_31365 [Bryobacteraceae bacterium]|nr:hypothetical protein [Bryobacteraceae bacterium]